MMTLFVVMRTTVRQYTNIKLSFFLEVSRCERREQTFGTVVPGMLSFILL